MLSPLSLSRGEYHGVGNVSLSYQVSGPQSGREELMPGHIRPFADPRRNTVGQESVKWRSATLRVMPCMRSRHVHAALVSTVPDRLAISAVFQYKTTLAYKIALGAVGNGKAAD